MKVEACLTLRKGRRGGRGNDLKREKETEREKEKKDGESMRVRERENEGVVVQRQWDQVKDKRGECEPHGLYGANHFAALPLDALHWRIFHNQDL